MTYPIETFDFNDNDVTEQGEHEKVARSATRIYNI